MGLSTRYLGHGVGLRRQHYKDFLESRPQVAWIEAISENFMAAGGRPLAVLEKVRRDMPVALHGVSLSIGSVTAPDLSYRKQLKALIERIEPALVSDHLCWGTHGPQYMHDLLPLPYTEESLAHVSGRVAALQDFLGRRILLENVSSYVAFQASTIPEWEFMSALAERADCQILLDINNIYVSAHNHGFDPYTYIDGISAARVAQIHLAGHSTCGAFIIDTHDHPVCDAVWQLYRHAVRRLGRVSTLIEWDDAVPELSVLLAQSQRAAREETRTLSRQAQELEVPL